MQETNTKQKITTFQIVALLSCLLLNMQDGFDILSISYSANAIATDMQLSPQKLGMIFSASLFGILIGAMFLAPYADRFGRKTMTIAGLLISGIGMIGAAIASNGDVLMLSRCLTGIGIGAILASLNTLVAEYAGNRFRGIAISIFQVGYSLGAMTGGMIAAWLLDIGSWRHVFAFGALLSFVFVPVVMFLPESIQYLAKSGRPDALAKINAIHKKLGRAQLDELPDQGQQVNTSFIKSVAQLFTADYRWRTLLIWLAYFFLLVSLYFALSWVPKLLIEQGMTPAQGIRGGILLNAMGVIGIATFALLSLRIRPPILAVFYLLGVSVVLFYLGTLDVGDRKMLLVVATIGFFVHASMIALYAVTPTLYPSQIRATGTGWAIGISRAGAILGPWLTGVLLAAGWAPKAIYPVFAIPTLFAALCVGVLAYLLRSGANSSAQT